MHAWVPFTSRCPPPPPSPTWYCRAYDHRGVPLPIVRHLVRQTLEALDYLHTQCQIIHTGERELMAWRQHRLHACQG